MAARFGKEVYVSLLRSARRACFNDRRPLHALAATSGDLESDGIDNNHAQARKSVLPILEKRDMWTRIFRLMCLGSVVAVGLAAGAQAVHAQGYANLSCGQLWYERNRIFAEYGHCFKTPQAINAFGRACFPPYGRLPPSAQGRVNDIIYWERRKGCSG